MRRASLDQVKLSPSCSVHTILTPPAPLFRLPSGSVGQSRPAIIARHSSAEDFPPLLGPTIVVRPLPCLPFGIASGMVCSTGKPRKPVIEMLFNGFTVHSKLSKFASSAGPVTLLVCTPF